MIIQNPPGAVIVAQCAATTVAGSWSLHHLLTNGYHWAATPSGTMVFAAAALFLVGAVGMFRAGEPARGYAHAAVTTVVASWVLGTVANGALASTLTPAGVASVLTVASPVVMFTAHTVVLRYAQHCLAGRVTTHILYIFHDKNHNPVAAVTSAQLYVGITNSLWHRLRQHAETKSWWPDVAYVTISYWPTRKALEATERHLIRKLGQRHNMAHNSGDRTARNLRGAA